MTREEFLALMFTHMIQTDGELAFKVAQVAADYEREQCARLVEEMVEKNYDLDDFANSVRAGAMRLCSDGRPKWLKVSMEVAAEREACERLVWDTPEPDDEYVSHREAIAAAIRARGGG